MARARLLLERSQLGGAHVLLAERALLALCVAPEGEHVLRREQRARARRARREATKRASRRLRVDGRSKHEERGAQHGGFHGDGPPCADPDAAKEAPKTRVRQGGELTDTPLHEQNKRHTS